MKISLRMSFVLALASLHAKQDSKHLVRLHALKGIAQWSVLTYIQADNNLDQFAYYNINAMQKGVRATDQVNVLVQWDKPGDNKTWRYRITPGGKIEDESLSSEMGYNPSAELFGGMQWVVDRYPALHYALILWNHGSGVQDFSPGQRPRYYSSWIQPIGVTSRTLADRGILYDDSQGTCLTNQGLVNALNSIKTLLGRNLDILGMDACLMAMLEICYEIKNCVDYYVASQELVPGEGWDYKAPLQTLTTMPTISPAEFAANIVTSYGRFYRKRGDAPTFTMSAVNLSLVNSLESALNRILSMLKESKKVSTKATVSAVKKARAASLQMEDFPEYIDLGTFFAELSKRFGDKRKVEIDSTQKRVSFNRKARSVRNAAQDGITAINQFVMNNVTGPRRTRALGVSIYYPSRGSIDASYKNTPFAKNTNWMNFLREYIS